MASVKEQFARLQGYEEDWDGYGAEPIRRDVVRFAEEILPQFMRHLTPPPIVTPMSHGGVMLEWNEAEVELEIEIEAPGRIWFSAEAASEGWELEGPLTNDLTPLHPVISALTPKSRV